MKRPSKMLDNRKHEYQTVTEVAGNAMSILVAIASYGRAQDHYLNRLLTEFRKCRMRVRTVVLTNELKPVADAEVRIGLPSPNSYSLPFAHKQLFAENIDKYDLFIYTEDDTLITERHIESFLDAQRLLEADEIPGFIRSESNADGHRFITSIHNHFHWVPESAVQRGGEVFASLSNQHSGCFMVTRQQLRKAIDSGGFLVPPHSERYGMLETAASDLYTQCGLRRLVCVSKIHDFVVAHLPNKYNHYMGIPVEELELQVQALCDLARSDGWKGSMFEPDSGARQFRWSCDLYAQRDDQILQAVPSTAQTVLSVGCGSGGNEAALLRNGVRLTAVPFDAVFDKVLRDRGVRTCLGPFPQSLDELHVERFDVILLCDLLHLVDNPALWLQRLAIHLKPDGCVVASVPNTGDIIEWVKDWRQGRRRALLGARTGTEVHGVNQHRLRAWCRSAGLDRVKITPSVQGLKRQKWVRGALKALMASRFILTASRGKSK